MLSTQPLAFSTTDITATCVTFIQHSSSQGCHHQSNRNALQVYQIPLIHSPVFAPRTKQTHLRTKTTWNNSKPHTTPARQHQPAANHLSCPRTRSDSHAQHIYISAALSRRRRTQQQPTPLQRFRAPPAFHRVSIRIAPIVDPTTTTVTTQHNNNIGRTLRHLSPAAANLFSLNANALCLCVLCCCARWKCYRDINC